ncbi:Probable iron export permease protein FetB [hydrothermal vent metagenome]|uniref:Probable iron export permease protein FetB n=1 Tax=hydrothermal vent metagenome TaxID=652676 RepID=A0A3B0ZKN2_9ZZZZ
MSPIYQLDAIDLSIAAVLVILLALLSFRLRLGISRQMLIAGARTVIQLLLIGMLLKVLFSSVNLLWITLIAFIMLSVAGYEVMQRQHHRFTGWWGFGMGSIAMFVSSFTITVLALKVIIHVDPWYSPQYSIPLLGMMLGNTMNGIAIGLDRLTRLMWSQRAMIENRLMLGEKSCDAVAGIRRECIRSGMIPIINAMAVAGVVSLPGMMTGQILSGTEPMIAVKYQILIMFLITAGTGFGTWIAIEFGSRHMFDDRQRLRLDRLKINETEG